MNPNRRTALTAFLMIVIFVSIIAFAGRHKDSALAKVDRTATLNTTLGDKTTEGTASPDPKISTQPFPQEQTLEGITATLDWLEVDETAMRYRVSMTGYEIPDNVSPENIFLDISISIDPGPFNIEGSDAISVRSSTEESGKITQEETVYIDINADDVPALDVDINVQVGGFDALPVHQDTSYGEINELVPLPLVGNITYSVTVPVHQAAKLDLVVQETQVAGDLAMQLESLHLRGANSNALLCFRLPPQGDWQIDLRNSEILAIYGESNREPILPRGWSMADPKISLSEAPGQRCVFLKFELRGDQLPSRIGIHIPRLIAPFGESPTNEQVNRAIQALAELGIKAVYNPTPHTQPLEIASFPESMEAAEAYSLLWSALQDSIDGPWEFDIAIPEMQSVE